MAQFPTLFQRPDRITAPLYVISTVFNSPRFRSRYKLYEDFARMVDDSGAILYTVEVAFGERAFAVTSPDNPRHLQLRTSTEIWHKERALNLLVQRLPREWQYLAWIDGDLRFVRPDWDDEILHALQHYAVIQPWTQALDLSSTYEVVGAVQRSLGWAVAAGEPVKPSQYYYGGPPGAKFFHPGYAWATRRDIWDGLGGLLDTPILGSADNLMAQALLGQADSLIPAGASAGYRARILEWQERAEAVVKRNLGATSGLLLHHWHGAKAARRYQERNQIIIDTQFDPDTDLRVDWQGLYHLSHRNDARTRMLRDQVRGYFHGRREDDPSP